MEQNPRPAFSFVVFLSSQGFVCRFVGVGAGRSSATFGVTMRLSRKQVILVIAVAAAVFALVVVLPNFIRVRSVSATAACINNLRQIQAGKDQWALENHKGSNDVPTWDDIRVYIGRSGTTGAVLTCPAAGTYTLGSVGTPPTCSIGGDSHTLP